MPKRLCLLLLLSVALSAQKKSATPIAAGASDNRLPVKRVVLYKNGIGYFEHSARIRGTQDLNIDFTSAQLNDVLKSLTVVDLGEGRISSVRYNSIAALSERLKGLRLPFGEQITRDDFLSALRGARVDVRSGSASASGKLLSVEKVKKQVGKDETVEVTQFSVVTDGGEMRSFELGPGTSVRLADRDLNDEVGRYLNLVGSSRARDVRRMTITATGSGERDVFVSYISEVPVWKSTYRIILPEKGKPILQGWAIVDNTIGEDWKDVHLSLVAGAPQSFVQNISQPLYTRRPEVELPKTAMLTPQSHEATLEGETVVPPPPAPSAAETVEVNAEADTAQASGVGGGVYGKQVQNLPMSARPFDRFANLAPGVARMNPEAEGKALGDFFEYDLRQDISIGKNQSALVPIIQAPIEADKVTIWNANSVPLRAVWVKNNSGQILDSGTFNIIEEGTFAGEGLLDVLHSEERRLLSYAADTAIHVKRALDSSQEPYTRVRIANGLMILTHELRQSNEYTIRNADTSPREVVVEHPANENWTLSDKTPKPEESSSSYHRFRVKIGGGKTETLKVGEYRPEESSLVLTNLSSDFVAVLSNQKRITPAMQQAFDRILAQKQKIGGIDRQISERNQESAQIGTDQTRLRENMKALKGSAEEKALIQRYTGQLNQQEDRLAALRKETADLTAQRNSAQRELERMVLEINLDEGF